MADTTISSEVLTTVDGTPLKVSLQRALARNRRRALMLAAPLLVFISIAFVVPIIDMLYRSIENSVVEEVLPNAVVALADWDAESGETPPEAVFAALHKDVVKGFKLKTLGKLARRLNYDKPGMSSLFRKSGRRSKKMTGPNFRDQFLKIDKKWGDVTVWSLIKRESDIVTASYFLAAVDMRYSEKGEMTAQPEERQIYGNLFLRTILMSIGITFLCLLLGYPVAYLLSTLPMKTSSLLMILVLLPFWTSLLVRTTSWIALLQTQGILNDLLVFVGFLSDDGRVQLIHNKIGTFVAMTHILLPFMILPLYSVMKTIPPSYMRAARSMGANPALAFIRVYLPQTVPGIGAGGILCFILAIGYYITPALVGGQSGTFISNFIADHVSTTLNWGLAAALGVILLGIVLFMYFLYDKIVGINNMKLG